MPPQAQKTANKAPSNVTQMPTGTPPPKATKASTAPADTGIDLSKLTPEQLRALQKQLKSNKSPALAEHKDERFNIIDTMLKEKNEDGSFKWTTRQIFERLEENDLTDKADADSGKNEIKKIQARKQFLEKKRDKQGNLVYTPNTFGYKPAEGGFGALRVDTVTNWFSNVDNVNKLTPDQKKAIAVALAA